MTDKEQKPVAWMTHYSGISMPMFHRTKESALGWQKDPEPLPLYTSPQPETKPEQAAMTFYCGSKTVIADGDLKIVDGSRIFDFGAGCVESKVSEPKKPWYKFWS